jgi:hypothetical protein
MAWIVAGTLGKSLLLIHQATVVLRDNAYSDRLAGHRKAFVPVRPSEDRFYFLVSFTRAKGVT